MLVLYINNAKFPKELLKLIYYKLNAPRIKFLIRLYHFHIHWLFNNYTVCCFF